ncbi:multiple monosaccharide ABC transporter substrate-binding protein [Glycomyces tenuis]|uniref:multiple monosaccharide ABC transporter substrate-binding protein n=1 Tax=Glycomyces tenuis TaxID=58116 RepID=UPI000404F781|nr:multiple monosaccharide ABC transporter substrate-binding protein [Glycomyces tenuis]
MNVNRRHLLTGSIGATAVALTASACASEDGGGDGDAKKVGIAMPTKTSERWILDGDNLKASFEEEGYEVTLQYANDEVDTQVSQIETMVSQGQDLLVIAAINNEALNGVLAQAKEQDITVIAYDRLILGTEDVDYYATFDNHQVGVLQGGYIVTALDLENAAGPFNIELFAGSLDDNNTKYFFGGAMEQLQPYIDEGKLVIVSGQTDMEQVATERWDGATAQARMDDILSTHYGSAQVHAVLSPYDGISRGVIASLEGAGYTLEDLPVVTGQDAEAESIQYIVDGRQTSTVFKDTRELAATTVDIAVAVANGDEPEVNDTETYDNGVKVVPSMLLEPVSVDIENYQEVVIDSGYLDELQQ